MKSWARKFRSMNPPKAPRVAHCSALPEGTLASDGAMTKRLKALALVSAERDSPMNRDCAISTLKSRLIMPAREIGLAKKLGSKRSCDGNGATVITEQFAS